MSNQLAEGRAAPAAEQTTPSAARIPASAWYLLVVLSAINFFAFVDKIAVAILLQPIKLELHLNDQQLGLISGLAFALLYALVGVPLAWLADRSGRVKLITACLTLWSLMTALSGAARSFPQLFLARMGVGLGEAGCVPPAHSLLGDTFPRQKRAIGISLFNASSAVGAAAGMILVGVLGEKLGWRATLQIVGLAGLPLALLTLVTLREPPRPGLGPVKESPARSIGALLRRPAYLNLAIGYSVAQICTDGSSQWFPAFLVRSFGMRLSEIGLALGLVTALFGVCGVVSGGFLVSRLVGRDPRWEAWIPAITLALCVPGFALTAAAPSATAAIGLKAVITLFSAAGQAVATAALQSYAEPYRRAMAVSLMLFLGALLGNGAGPYLIGLVSDLLQPTFGIESLRYAMLVPAVVGGWAVLHYLLAARWAMRDRQD